MKIIILFLMVVLLASADCSVIKKTNSMSNANLTLRTNLDADLSENQTLNANVQPTRQDKNFRLMTIESKIPLVWIGVISSENFEIPKADGGIWNNAEYEDDKIYSRIGTAIEVDIMNCAGYLISGKLNKIGDYGWELETNPKTAAKDAPDKVKQCNSGEPFPSGQAFAIAPPNINRQNIKIGAIDTKEIYSSLPKAEKKWLEEEKKVYAEDNGAYYRRKEKGKLSLQEDNWTDIDGNGEIDLIMLSTVCTASDPEGDRCSSILMKINGKWKVVGSTQKA